MGAHSHSHEHGHSHEHHAGRSLRLAILVTSVFMGVEWVGGVWSNSLALISDAFHMLGDLASLLLSAFVLFLSHRPAGKRMTFGYHRLEILGGLLSGLAVWAIAAFLMKESISRYANPEPVQAEGVIIVSLLGLMANLFSMRFLHDSAHHSLNVKAAYLHVVSDAMGSIGALISGIILWKTGYREIDPLISFGVAVLMVVSSWHLVREAALLLLEGAPSHLQPDEIQIALAKISGIREIHDLHVWQISSGKTAMSAHLVTDAAVKSADLLFQATQLMVSRFQIHHTTFQMETQGQSPSEHCHDCNDSAE